MRWWMVLGLCMASWAQGADIQIVGVGRAASVAISLEGMHAGEDEASVLFRQVVHANLERWGWFRVLEGGAAVYAVRGSTQAGARGLSVDLEVVALRTGRTVHKLRDRVALTQARALARDFVDALTEAVHGVPGVAATRIAFVGSVGVRKDLFLIGADGWGMSQLTQDGVPSFRPAWDPTGSALYYTSFLRGFPDVYRIDLGVNRRVVVSREAGINAGASVSPDGRALALVLSREGNPEVYIRTLSDGRLERLTHTPHHAEASPVWSPDGRQLAFVSDMQGGPHVFIVPREGGRPQRVSLRGSQNVSPHWGSDGRIVYSSRRLGRFQLVAYDPVSGTETQLTDAPVDHENPCWGRDGRHLVYARREGRISSLYLLDTHTGSQIRLTTKPGDWYFPAWSQE